MSFPAYAAEWPGYSSCTRSLYPLIGLIVTHPYPETPSFGVAPCPTTIFTLGLLLLVRHPRPWLLAAVPLLWSVLGGSAAFILNTS